MICAKLTLREVKKNDMEDLFRWRNHPEVRKHFFHSTPISLNEHEQWFLAKINDPNTVIYIACSEKEKVGTIRYKNTQRGIYVSVMLNPDFFDRGFGSKIIELGTKKFIREKKPKKSILAEIKCDNIASIKAFQKAGFQESYITYVFKSETL